MPWQWRLVFETQNAHAEIKMNKTYQIGDGKRLHTKLYYNHCRLGIRSDNETYKSRRFPFLLAIFIHIHILVGSDDLPLLTEGSLASGASKSFHGRKSVGWSNS